MLKKSLLLAASLVLAVPAAEANDRYATRPPVVVSPDLTAPWVMQLTGQGVRPAVSQRRIVTRQQAQQRRSQRQRNPESVQLAAVTGAARPVQTQMDPMFLPQIVAYETTHKAGTIVIDTNNRFLYLVLSDGKARRYGVGVGKPGFEWAGTHKVTSKREWPSWTPPKEMIAREAAKGHYLPAFMEGGPENPLGSRALYLGSTLYRIHGTNAPWTIGYAVSSGCIRMRNEDVIDLYERVAVGTKVIVI
ncbi:L,D-transpeptidase (plasmid) [Rhizobium sp. TRM96647]|uniref:L,D-transpeptidase n=1 Tax=unclassified Rhizobium TaxID=2613769 RepID=UPI001E3B6EAD|nr:MULTISPECIES: L,D-transpeptidase [unclassified Rhizobium]MCD2180637.1 L,D-transpeptidase [Rhizobium sp. GN54]MCV3735373.1 L,D-transpeptidase [Rhizobium sp. TRM96647]MCV3757864.1 L,D-transpeptidase [Rhizobium sp. TRM96650]